MQEIYSKLNEILKTKFPTQQDRDEAITAMGEVILAESMVEIAESITDDMTRTSFVTAVNEGRSEDADNIAEAAGVDIYSILKNKSKEILDDTTI